MSALGPVPRTLTMISPFGGYTVNGPPKAVRRLFGPPMTALGFTLPESVRLKISKRAWPRPRRPPEISRLCTESTASVVFWTISLMTLMAAMLAAPGWVRIAARHWPWIIALGVVAAVGQHLLTQAFRLAPPSLVAPFEYTALLWGIAIDRFIWHVLPSARVLAGGGVVIASGLFLIWRESRQPWQPTTEQGRMPPRSSTVEHAARQQKEDFP